MVWCEKYFDIVNQLGVDYEYDGRTDGRTDILIANASLNYCMLRGPKGAVYQH